MASSFNGFIVLHTCAAILVILHFHVCRIILKKEASKDFAPDTVMTKMSQGLTIRCVKLLLFTQV